MGITGSPSAQMSIRAAVVNDLHRVVALLASHADETGDDRVPATELRSWWTAPEFDLGWQVLVAEAAGELVGYADIGDPNGDRTQLWIDLRVPASGRTLRADAHLLDGALTVRDNTRRPVSSSARTRRRVRPGLGQRPGCPTAMAAPRSRPCAAPSRVPRAASAWQVARLEPSRSTRAWA